MSLRKLVLALLIANLGYFIYNQGWLQTMIGSDDSQREPNRLAKQINPEAIRVTPIAEVVTPAAEPCLKERERWLIYMGPYANTAQSEKKKAELAKIGISGKDIAKVGYPIGLSLGQFESELVAKDELKRLSSKGVRTASVVLWDKAPVPCTTADKP